jgi:uncharacterized integral membrane protein (TIGR00698 family)
MSRDQVPGLAVAAGGVGLAMLLHRLVPGVGVLTWAVLLGALVANTGLLPAGTRPGLAVATRRLLRAGIVLLGFSLSLVTIAQLGPMVIGLVVVTLVGTLLATVWAGRRLGLGRPRSLLIATGFAICGASAIAAMERTADGDEDDVATAVAMVTICGTVAMIAVPLLQAPFGLTDTQLGIWAGASVHEVGQVVAAAGPAGAAAVAIAVVVKLTRVLLLAPVVATVGILQRRSRPVVGASPPVVPLFVLGFLGCVLLRTLGAVPAGVLPVLTQLQTLALAAALFSLGTGVRLAALVRRGGPALVLGALSTVAVTGFALAGVLWLG